MKFKGFYIIILLLSINLGFKCSLNSQIKVIPLIREFEYPLRANITVPDIISRPQNIKSLPDSIRSSAPTGFYYIDFFSQFIMPNDPYLIKFYEQGKNDSSRSLLFKHLPGNKVAFIMDGDGDGNFFEEKIDTIADSKSVLVMRELTLIEGSKPCMFMLPLEVKIDYKGEDFQSLSIRNLLKYRMKYPIGQDTLSVDIRVHQLNINCYLHLNSPKDTLIRFRLNEPFIFKSYYYKLTKLDLCQDNVILERLEGDKIRGYKEGFYMDLATIQRLTKQNMMSDITIDWDQKPYLLLHFWGEWCDPCRAEIKDVKELDEHLEKNKQVQIIHYPFVYNDELLERTQNYIKLNNLSPVQSFCISNNCSGEVKVKEECDVCSFTRVSDYPKYILLDQQGKILFINKQGGAKIAVNKLKSLGLY